MKFFIICAICAICGSSCSTLDYRRQTLDPATQQVIADEHLRVTSSFSNTAVKDASATLSGGVKINSGSYTRTIDPNSVEVLKINIATLNDWIKLALTKE